VSQLVPRADVVAPIATAVVVTPKATVLALDATIESHALSHVFGVAVPAFPFPEDRHIIINSKISIIRVNYSQR